MTKKKRTYFTLLERTPGELWAPQFGDYDKSVVEQERRDMRDSVSFIKGTGFKIIETDGSQAAISQAVDDENGVIIRKQPADVRRNIAKLDRKMVGINPAAKRLARNEPDAKAIKAIYKSEGASACLSLCKHFKQTKREMLLLLASFEA